MLGSGETDISKFQNTGGDDMYSNTRKLLRPSLSGLSKIPYIYKRSTTNDDCVVDISGLMDDNERAHRHTAAIINEHAIGNGFLYLANHGVPRKLIDSVYEQSKEFFSLTEEKKLDYYVGNQRNHRGYVPTTEKGDYEDEKGPRRYEAFDLGLDLPEDDKDYLQGNPLLGPNLWPDLPDFRNIITQYTREVERVAMVMFYAFEIILKLPKGYFNQFLTKPVSQLRLIHYLQNQQQVVNQDSNMGAHTDYECFTILHSKYPGLQVMNMQDKWVDAQPIENTFYFNIGDMMEAWSGGRFVSTVHRVKNTQNERFSIPFFAATNYHTEIKPLVINKESEKKYCNIRTGDHIVSQMLRDFPYLLRRYNNGQIKLGNVKRTDNPFENRINV